jgi:hypothetical protein
MRKNSFFIPTTATLMRRAFPGNTWVLQDFVLNVLHLKFFPQRLGVAWFLF